MGIEQVFMAYLPARPENIPPGGIFCNLQATAEVHEGFTSRHVSIPMSIEAEPLLKKLLGKASSMLVKLLLDELPLADEVI
eukprot:5856357-Amphidinium_carterae.1